MISYAATHRERIRRLVLYSTFSVLSRDEQTRDGYRAFAALIRSSWGTASKVLVDSSSILPSDVSRAELEQLAAQERATTSPEVAARFTEAMLDVDVTSLLPLIGAPTLVICRRGDPIMPPSYSQRVAAGIRGARFKLVDGDAHNWGEGDSDTLAEEFLEFLDEVPAPSVDVEVSTATVRTIVFTDLQGHTELMDRLGDQRGRDVLRAHEQRVRDALRFHGGAEVKSMGDGFMASFGSAQQALACARDIQQAFAEAIEGEQLRVRVGVNAGEPIAEDSDLFGASVIIAARVAAKATGAQVLVSDVVRQLVAGKGFLFSDTGEHVLKGFEEPVRIWELRWA
jgi:class 3 adenylate cyclase